jgi:TPR repeat protein
MKQLFFLTLFVVTLYGATKEALVAYQHGEYQKAFKLYMDAAKEGDVEAQNGLSYLYFHGLGTQKDVHKGIEWLQKAAQTSDVRASLDLAMIYLRGDEVPQNMQKAAHYLQIAAQKGDTQAQYNLALMYYNGDGVKQDVKKAASLLEKAALQGDKRAKMNVGRIYMQALDFKKAKYWLQQNLKEGDAQAQILLDEIEEIQNP